MILDVLMNTGDESYSNIVRLYNFAPADITAFIKDIQHNLIDKNKELELDKAFYINALNCSFVLVKSENEKGIYSQENNHLICALNEHSYKEMIDILSVFINEKHFGFNWLVDSAVSEFDFLISLRGEW